MEINLLKNILDDEFLETLAKSADLYKIGSNSVLDPEEIRIGLKVVPRAVMSLLISELAPMAINSSKDIKLPFGKMAIVRLNKNAADDFTGSVYDNNKLVYDFKNRSIPGLGIILLSTFELYNMNELDKPHNESEMANKQVQKLIDERMELHSLVSKVVEEKMLQREALHKLMMSKLNEALKANEKIADITKIAHQSSKSGEYFQGMANGLEVADSIANKKEPNFAHAPKAPLNVSPKDIVKKEVSKKELPLKKFLDRKKKPTEYSVKIEKSETINCPDCMQPIFGESGLSACICFGEDQNRKIWLKKTEDGISLRFSKNWSPDNIEMLLETLRRK